MPVYQALYRKWRPQTFDDVVGQAHITDTLKYQVANDRLSHAYLFTGTRGTGKTSCAKILARAVNCENPVDGNPCNCCPACRGISDGSVLDVLELDAASNNGVDHVRALRDEAIYTPAAVKKRVYIIDEVHMLSTAAFNALLKILEEPSPHLMFILATTELHKVLPTVLSRCQRFSFKRILPEDIAGRLSYVADREGVDLRAEGASLLARLADGGLRDALSLLDQCAAGGGTIDRERVISTLGLAGNLRTAHLFNHLRRGNAAGALEELGALYAAGKDVAAVLSELSDLARDIMIRATAPQGGRGLMTGSYDEETLNTLGKNISSQRLIYMISLLEETRQALRTSANGRTLAEICLIRMSDPALDDSPMGMSARIAKLEAAVAGGGLLHTEKREEENSAAVSTPPAAEKPPFEPDPAPRPKQPVTVPDEPARTEPEMPVSENPNSADDIWKRILGKLRGVVSPIDLPFLRGESVSGVCEGDRLILRVTDDFVYDQINRPAVTQAVAQVASAHLGRTVQVAVRREKQPVSDPAAPHGSIGDLKSFLQNYHG